MMAGRGRSAIAFSMLAFAIVANGCTVGGKSMAIDSNSRMPFFGLELKERKPKDSSPAYRSIGNTTREGRGGVALQTVPMTTSGSKRLRPSQATMLAVVVQETTESRSFNAIPGEIEELRMSSAELPRTDTREKRTKMLPSSSPADFQ